MIDRKLLRDGDFEETARKLGRKGVSRDELEAIRQQLEARRELTHEGDELRADLNRRAASIGKLMKAGQREEAMEARTQVANLKERLAAIDQEQSALEAKLEDALLRIPNLPFDETPDGHGDEDNVVLRTHGPAPESFAGRDMKPHWEVAERLDLLDVERGAKLAGSMFSVLYGDGARLLRGLVELGLALNRDTYREVVTPHMVRSEIFTMTGQLPKFADDAYSVANDDLWLIPTGEVPLMGLHAGEILATEELPKRYMTHTACFRREAGSAGKDTRGMQRLHEFHKVELVVLCTDEQALDEHERMLAAACKPLELLGLPYRILDLCAGDLTFSSARVRDIEVYVPGADRWLEVSSVGMFTDFQARRLKLRHRPGGTKTKPTFVHALNGSGLATPRVWAAVIEHYQQPDGSVVVPEVLRAYMGKDLIPAP